MLENKVVVISGVGPALGTTLARRVSGRPCPITSR